MPRNSEHKKPELSHQSNGHALHVVAADGASPRTPVRTVLGFEVDNRGRLPDDLRHLLPEGTSVSGESSLLRPGAPDSDAQKCGVCKTLANIFIAFVGAGILGLPHAFQRSGMLLGAAFMVLLACLAYYCIGLLVQCKKALESKGVVTYSEVAEATLGDAGKAAVEALLVLSQTGFCAAYVIFIVQNMQSLLGLSPVAIVLVVLPFQALLAMLRDLSALAPFSLVADFAHLVGMLVVLKDDMHSYTTAHPTVVPSKGAEAVPFLFGVVIYCYEGIGMILPIEDAMRDKSKFRPVLTIGFTIITVIFLIFGSVGYAAFGEDTKDIITNNLPDDWSTVSVKVALCCALFFTFPIMMVPVYEILERTLERLDAFQRAVAPRRRWMVFRVARVGIVALVGLVAISVPGFGAFISFIGSFCCASLAFILPATCHLVLFSGTLPAWQSYVDYLLIMFGFTGMVFGVGESLHDMLRGPIVAHG